MSSRTPQDNFMFVPHSLLCDEVLEVKIAIGFVCFGLINLVKSVLNLKHFGFMICDTYVASDLLQEKDGATSAGFKCGERLMEKEALLKEPLKLISIFMLLC